MVRRTAEPLGLPNALDRIRSAEGELNALGLYLFCTIRAFCSRRGVHRAVAQLSSDAHPPVFSGGTVDRNIHAFEAVSGKILWEFTTNSGIIARPTTFTVDGKQYLAVHAGWEGDARAMANAVRRFFPGQVPNVPPGGAIWVFALNE
jgi:hypothetical protein